MERLVHEVNIVMRLQCPCCRAMDALDCKIIRSGEGLWVTLRNQACACCPEEVYEAWDDVWQEARHRALEHWTAMEN